MAATMALKLSCTCLSVNEVCTYDHIMRCEKGGSRTDLGFKDRRRHVYLGNTHVEIASSINLECKTAHELTHLRGHLLSLDDGACICVMLVVGSSEMCVGCGYLCLLLESSA